MMDVVYPLANKSKGFEDFELRFSLRTLARQPWVRNVYIVGHRPKWLQNVKHLQCPDPYSGSKDANIINKIMFACCQKDLSEKFVVNSDDQYFLRPVTMAELIAMPPDSVPLRNREVGMRNRSNNWRRRVAETTNWAAKHGYVNHIYDSHRPYVIEKEEYIKTMCISPWARGNGMTTHIYFNLRNTPLAAKAPGAIRIKQALIRQHIRQRLNGATFLNHNDQGLNQHMKQLLRDRFPEPSPWES